MKIRFLPFLFCLPFVATAQEYRGTILGRISDPASASVTGAIIEVVNIKTNVSTTAFSNEDGNYQAPFLIPGDYRVRVTHPGFKAIEQPEVRVSTNASLTLNFSLELGSVTQSVEVKGETPLLNMANADVGQVIQNTYVNKMDFSFNRNVQALVFLSPGVTGTEGGTYTAGVAFAANGGGGKQGGNEYLVDGFASPVSWGKPTFMPPLDEVEEMKVTTVLFDASMGRTNGAVINMTTKGGTNELHGTLYFYRNPVGLAANGWSNNKYGIPRRSSGFWQYGFQTGGPVYLPKLYNGHNKTFFSASVEQDHDPRSLAPQLRVPTALERQGDFSQTLSSSGKPLVIYDPASTIVNGSTATRQAFPGAKIPTSRFDPTGAAALNLFPLPNLNVAPQIGVFNWSSNGGTTRNQENYSGRIDHYISDRQRLFARLGFMNRLGDSPDDKYFPGYSGPGIGHSYQHFWNWGADDTITISPTLFATLHISVASIFYNLHAGGAGLDPKTIHTPDQIISSQAVSGYPYFRLGEGFGNIGSDTQITNNVSYSAVANFSKMLGNHNIRWGVDYRLLRDGNITPGANGAGNFTFDSTFTRSDPFTNSTSTTSGTAMASLLLGLPASGAIGYAASSALQSHNLGLFIQEDWKVSPRLTLNFGLRYDIETPVTERYNRQSYGFDRNAALPIQVPGLTLRGGVLFAGVDDHPRGSGPKDTNNFGPRFGFAYQVAPKTVLRGGFGWFYAVQGYNGIGTSDPGVFGATTNFVGSINGGATPFNTLANPFPNGMTPANGSSIGLLAQVGNALSIPAPNRLNPYNLQWQFDVQRELPSRIVVEIGYVGMHSLKLLENFNLNELPDQYLAQGAAQNKTVNNPFFGVLPATSTLGASRTIAQRQLWLSFPQFTSLTMVGNPTGNAIYHSLQAKAEKRLTHGLTILTHYTYSKLMVNNTTSLVNARHYRAISQYDQTHVFRQAFTYDLPVQIQGHSWSREILRQTASGWQLAGWWDYTTGLPLSVTQVNGRPFRSGPVANSGPVENRLGDHVDPATGRVLNPYFNTNAFQALPSQYMVSPEPPVLGELRQPAGNNFNLSAYKFFPLTERLRLMASIEFDSVLNHPVFDSPGINMSNPATFGVITSERAGDRSGKFGLRLWF